MFWVFVYEREKKSPISRANKMDCRMEDGKAKGRKRSEPTFKLNLETA
jgi:hypothetical protein